jgi:hypothetical protein
VVEEGGTLEANHPNNFTQTLQREIVNNGLVELKSGRLEIGSWNHKIGTTGDGDHLVGAGALLRFLATKDGGAGSQPHITRDITGSGQNSTLEFFDH